MATKKLFHFALSQTPLSKARRGFNCFFQAYRSWMPARATAELAAPPDFGRNLTLPPFFSLSSPKEERAGVRSPLFPSSNPLTPALSPLGRGEGVGAVPEMRPPPLSTPWRAEAERRRLNLFQRNLLMFNDKLSSIPPLGASAYCPRFSPSPPQRRRGLG